MTSCWQSHKSNEEALKVAATFEEISIMDLEKELATAETEDVRSVFQGLLAGSLNHLRTYASDLKDLGIQYDPRYLEREEFERL